MTVRAKVPSRLRVMMIGPFPRSPDRIDGGVAAATMYLAQGLAADPRIELVAVRICNEDVGSDVDLALGWPTVDLPLGRASLATLYWRQRRRFRQILKMFAPEIVHAQGADLAGLLATGCGLPSVVTIHGLLGECAKLQTNRVAKARAMLSGLLTEHRTVRRTQNLISISPYVGQYYQDDFSGSVYEIPNAVAPQFFTLCRSPEKGRFLFAGRISKGKGVHDLVKALAQIPGKVSRVVFAGETSDPAFETLVRADVQRLGLEGHVSFVGLLNESSLLAEFARAEALVLPSYQETAPMVIQQAMAAGLPIVATRVGGIPQQIEHNLTGLLVDSGNVQALGKCLERFYDEPSLGARLASAGKAVAAARYQPHLVAAATRVAYQEIIDKSRVGQVKE